MNKCIMSPGKYIQANNALSNLHTYVQHFGSKFFVIISESGKKRSGAQIESSFKSTDKSIEFATFHKECCKKEIKRLMDDCRASGCDCVIGVGGGKLLDTAKAVAHYLKLAVIIVPTIASTDAPCSALSVIYHENGVFEEYLVLPKNPELVIMDLDVIASSPSRFLVAGMGDALATYFEARAARASNATNMAGLLPARSAFALAELCYETLLAEGYKAKLAAEQNVITQALESIVEANTYLSGIGFESGGLGAAHAIHNGFTVLAECHHLNHGEKVAFGTLTQLVLENADLAEIEEVLAFCVSVGLPVTLEQMGVKQVDPKMMLKVAELATAEGETIHNMPFKVTAEDVYAAIMTADAMGRDFVSKNK